MTTYTAIANSEIDAESPITTGLMTKLRDNLLAVQEGDATAPNITDAPASTALDDTVTTEGQQSIGVGASYTIPAGVYLLAGGGASFRLDLWISAAWKAGITGSCDGLVISNGSNVRVFNGGSTANLNWQRFDG